MILFGVFCLSASSLLFELLLTRAFSITHWYHLSFMVIGIAMLGSGASGVYSAFPRRRTRALCLRGISFLCAVTSIGSYLLVKLIPLDSLRLPFERIQLLFLLATDLVLSLPFFFAGLYTCMAYLRMPERSGTVAFFSLTGAGVGAVLPAALLPVLGVGGGIAASALLALVPALFRQAPANARQAHRGEVLLAASVLLFCGLVVLVIRQRDGLLAVVPSPYKALPQLMLAPGARLVDSSASVWGALDSVESPTLRFAPGLSLGFTGALPAQTGLTVDGDALTVLTDVADSRAADLARATHAYAAYVLVGRPRSTLVVQRGGGIAVLCALAAGAVKITVVVDQPRVAAAMGDRYGHQGIKVIAGNPRSFLARRGERFDTIAVEDWGPSAPGIAGLSEEAILTIDAFRGYWRRLSDTGVLAVSRRILLPPSDAPRLFATALEAMRREGIGDPSEHIAVIRNWDTCTLLVSRVPVRGTDLSSLRSFADSMGFDLDWFPGVIEADTGRFNRIPGAPFYSVYASLARGENPTSLDFLDTAPQGDERPFPDHFIRLTRMVDYFRSTGERPSTLILSGELVAGAVFAASLLLSASLITVALAAGRHGGSRISLRVPLYFAGSGLGYLFAEIALLDSFVLLFDSPFVTLSIVLGGMLVFSGIGGRIAERLPRGALALVPCLIVIVLVLMGLFLRDSVRFVLPLPLFARILLSLALLAAPAILLGIPFPLGMRHAPADERQRAIAWAVNGSASVVASSSAALIAISRGSAVLLLAAAGSYLLVLLASGITGRRLLVLPLQNPMTAQSRRKKPATPERRLPSVSPGP